MLDATKAKSDNLKVDHALGAVVVVRHVVGAIPLH